MLQKRSKYLYWNLNNNKKNKENIFFFRCLSHMEKHHWSFSTAGSKPPRKVLKKKKKRLNVFKIAFVEWHLKQVPTLRWGYRRGVTFHTTAYWQCWFPESGEDFWSQDGAQNIWSYEFSYRSRRSLARTELLTSVNEGIYDSTWPKKVWQANKLDINLCVWLSQMSEWSLLIGV